MSNTLSYQQLAHMIDISAVQAPHGEQEIQEMLNGARTYGFGAVHVLPAWVSYTRRLLNDSPDGAQGIRLGSPVGFPSGGNHPAIKRAEAAQIVADGADELDMLINIGKLRSGRDDYVYDEIHGVIEAVSVPVKVIFETHYLTNDEIRRGCELCAQAGAQYVKTSTGWADTGATLENVAFIASCLAGSDGKIDGKTGIKAAGGIRDLDTLLKMYRLGARRFGINLTASVEIVKACQALPGGCVEVD